MKNLSVYLPALSVSFGAFLLSAGCTDPSSDLPAPAEQSSVFAALSEIIAFATGLPTVPLPAAAARRKSVAPTASNAYTMNCPISGTLTVTMTEPQVLTTNPDGSVTYTQNTHLVANHCATQRATIDTDGLDIQQSVWMLESSSTSNPYTAQVQDKSVINGTISDSSSTFSGAQTFEGLTVENDTNAMIDYNTYDFNVTTFYHYWGLINGLAVDQSYTCVDTNQNPVSC